MNFISVYNSASALDILYDLLAERRSHESISHKKMPSRDEHVAFVTNEPYLHWYLIQPYGSIVGAIYLSKQREIGISIFKRHRGHGYAKEAIKMLMEMHPGKFLANINPLNATSINLFRQFGFSHIQNTYEREEQE